MRSTIEGRRAMIGGLCILMMLVAAPAAAQEGGAGVTGSTILDLVIGGRSGGLGGALVADQEDSDAVFSNPAGLRPLERAAAISFERHVEDIHVGSVSGAIRLGGVTVAAGLGYIDFGSIPRIVPDPDLGGERGREEGTFGASETTGRLAVAAAWLDGRVSAGATAGFVAQSLDDAARFGVLADLGVQAAATEWLMLGASLRNIGPDIGGDAGGAPLPLQGRAGAQGRIRGDAGLGANLMLETVGRFEEDALDLIVGVEAGRFPLTADDLGAVLRAGYDTAMAGQSGVGPFTIGAGLLYGGFGVDYAFRSMQFFGATHRFGLRWLPGR